MRMCGSAYQKKARTRINIVKSFLMATSGTKKEEADLEARVRALPKRRGSRAVARRAGADALPLRESKFCGAPLPGSQFGCITLPGGAARRRRFASVPGRRRAEIAHADRERFSAYGLAALPVPRAASPEGGRRRFLPPSKSDESEGTPRKWHPRRAWSKRQPHAA